MAHNSVVWLQQTKIIVGINPNGILYSDSPVDPAHTGMKARVCMRTQVSQTNNLCNREVKYLTVTEGYYY